MDRVYRIDLGGQIAYAVRDGDDWRRLAGDPFGGYEAGGAVDEAQLRILAPVAPSKIVAVGLNYRDHAREMNKALPDEPLIFIKPSSAVIGRPSCQRAFGRRLKITEPPSSAISSDSAIKP